MIRDWDLWPRIIAYESDAGHLERFRRGTVAVAEAVRAYGITVAEATRRFAELAEAMRRHPAPTARK